MVPERPITSIIAPHDSSLDTAAAVWAIRRFGPSAGEASVVYVNPAAAVHPPEGTILVGMPYARGSILPTQDPDGGPGSNFRTVVYRYCTGRTQTAIEPLVRLVERSALPDVSDDPDAPVNLGDGNLAVVFRGCVRMYAGWSETDDRAVEQMSHVFDALYALVKVTP